MNVTRGITAFCILVGFLLPHAGIVAADLTGGGAVTNTAPQVVSITITPSTNEGDQSAYQTAGGSPTAELNDNGADYIEVTVVVYDANGEDDMTWINFSFDPARTLEDGTAWMAHEIVAGDKDADDPGFQENTVAGFDNGTADNGFLTFKFKHTIDMGDDPPNGALTSTLYTLYVEIKDSAGSTSSDSDTYTVYNYANLALHQGYYNSAGVNVTGVAGAVWGNWSGSSGTSQAGTTYLYATNSGSTGTGNLTISWNGQNLVNATSAGTIALTNLDYYEGEGANPSSVTSWGTLHANATKMKAYAEVTHSTASTTHSWTNYTIAIPSATPVGNYSQTFTWTAT